MKKHIISIVSENHSGILNKIAGLLRRKMFNIDSLTVGELIDKEFSKFTIVIRGNKEDAKKVSLFIQKLEEVVSVEIINEQNSQKREIALIVIEKTDKSEISINKIIENCKTSIDIQVIPDEKHLILQIIDNNDEIEVLIDILKKDENIIIKSFVRSGLIAVSY
jgi:acetolactate synthase-1/3 small subunit